MYHNRSQVTENNNKRRFKYFESTVPFINLYSSLSAKKNWNNHHLTTKHSFLNK